MSRLIFNKHSGNSWAANYDWNGYIKERCASGLMRYFGFIPNKITIAFKNPKEKGWKSGRVDMRCGEVVIFSKDSCTIMEGDAIFREFKDKMANNTIWIKGNNYE